MSKTKAICCLIVLICSALITFGAPAATSPRLGIVVEDSSFNTASDVLTAELSGKPGVQLVERAEIDKVYREQKLSAASRDYLKLGQVLGADGLLILQRQNEDTNQFIAIRHIAVNPGVILSANRFAWPMTNVTEWAFYYAKQIEPQFPKLGVSARDAIPLSIVNIRSAIASADVKETEAQLKLLLIERLSREPQFFVLERQRLQLLGEEKDLQADDSAFWSGAWLVDGTVDQAGYSKDRITIDARLAPPKGGGSPVHFQISGSRTNLPEVINRVALKIGESLKVAVASEWRPEDEAEQYLANAKWALRWGLYREAQAAADSAWALGRKDVDCATARLKAYLGELKGAIPTLSSYIALFPKKLATQPYIESYATKKISGLPFGGIYTTKRGSSQDTIALHFAWGAVRPDPGNIARAKHVVELYYDFIRSNPNAIRESRVSINGESHNEWIEFGVDTLISASRVLQQFNFCLKPEDQPATELAELRELVRTVADFISSMPVVRNSYFVGDRIPTSDESSQSLDLYTSFFMCKVNWGCFWQERPDDAIALYRDLMRSHCFCYVHSSFWDRDATMPRLVAWNERDKQRIPALWTEFTNSLNASTNILLQMEGKALEHADALTEPEARQIEVAWWKLVRKNRNELAGINVSLLFLGWHFIDSFEAQKNYLSDFMPYDFGTFFNLFSQRDYTRQQALELLPLITCYRSNIIAQSAVASRDKQFRAKCDALWMEDTLERQVRSIIGAKNSFVASRTPHLSTQIALTPLTSPRAASSEVVSNITVIRQFHALPSVTLNTNVYCQTGITAHRVQEDKLILNLDYTAYNLDVDRWSGAKGTRQSAESAVGIFDPGTGKWELYTCPPVDITRRNRLYHRTTLAHGKLYTSDGGRILKYEASNQRWQDLEIPNSGNCELFFVSERLFAANPNTIFEITDGGKGSRIIASNRRQPPVSFLDSEDLGDPALFEGPGRSVRLVAARKIFDALGDDWRHVADLPFTTAANICTPDGVLFRSAGNVCFLPRNATNVLVYLAIRPLPGLMQSGFPFQRPPPQLSMSQAPASKPLWELPAGADLRNSVFAARSSSFCALVDHSERQNIMDPKRNAIIGSKTLARDGYHAELLCFSPGSATPSKRFLKFEAPDARPPVFGSSADSRSVPVMGSPSWIAFSSQYLIFGAEAFFNIPAAAAVSGIGPKHGIWLLPLSEIDDAPAAHASSK